MTKQILSLIFAIASLVLAINYLLSVVNPGEPSAMDAFSEQFHTDAQEAEEVIVSSGGLLLEFHDEDSGQAHQYYLGTEGIVRNTYQLNLLGSSTSQTFEFPASTLTFGFTNTELTAVVDGVEVVVPRAQLTA